MKEIIKKAEIKVVCDICGKECKSDMGNWEYMLILGKWGYGTKHDLEKWEAHLCEDCSEDLWKYMESKASKRIERTTYSIGD